MKNRITEQEKNRILNLHQTSKNVYGDLVVESKSNRNHGIKYHVQLGVFSEKTPADFLAKAKQLDMPIKKIQYKGSLYRYVIKQSWTSYLGKLQLGLWAIRDIFPDAFIYAEKDGKRIGVKQAKAIESGEEYVKDGDVATETDAENLKFPNLELSSTLTLNQMPTFDPTKEGIVYQCDKKLGCAAYVRQELGEYQGNAWHAHRHNDPLVYSAFLSGMGKKKNEIEQLFNKINKSPGTLNSKQDSFDNEAKNIAKSFVPNQSKFSSLEIDDVVGLYYDKSDMHSSAFFEGMTGYDNNGTGAKLGDGPFMVKKDGTEWRPKDLGQNVEFQIGKTLTGGKGPGLNTHLGYVGAKNNGEPIIFHNVYGNVYATPLKELGKDGTAIVWAKRGKGTSGEEVVVNQKYDEVEQTTVGYFDYLYKKYIGN